MENYNNENTRSFLKGFPRYDNSINFQTLQNIEPSFDESFLPIPELENPDIHYRCPKCFNFPLIEFIDNNEEIIIYTCACYEKKRLKVKDLFFKDKDYKKNYLSFPEDNNIILDNINNQRKEEIIGYKCTKHKSEINKSIENNNFEYYCLNKSCGRNLCKDCIEEHLIKRHDLFVFDYENFETLKKIKEILKFEYNNKKENVIEFENESNMSLSEFEKLISEDVEIQKNNNKYKIIKTPKNTFKIIKKCDNDNMHKNIIELINIIINDYLNYPNYLHFVNIDNIHRFLIKESSIKEKSKEIYENPNIRIIFHFANNYQTKFMCPPSENLRNVNKNFLEKHLGRRVVKFFYNKYEIDEQLKIEEVINEIDKKRKIMDINVLEFHELDNIKIKEVKCSKCDDNIFLNIDDYKFNLYGCKNKHFKNKILFKDFMKTQKSGSSNSLSCDDCKRSSMAKSSFFKCISCNKILCLPCKGKHDKKHQVINFEEINYICNIHNGKYNKYCINCKKIFA